MPEHAKTAAAPVRPFRLSPPLSRAPMTSTLHWQMATSVSGVSSHRMGLPAWQGDFGLVHLPNFTSRALLPACLAMTRRLCNSPRRSLCCLFPWTKMRGSELHRKTFAKKCAKPSTNLAREIKAPPPADARAALDVNISSRYSQSQILLYRRFMSSPILASTFL